MSAPDSSRRRVGPPPSGAPNPFAMATAPAAAPGEKRGRTDGDDGVSTRVERLETVVATTASRLDQLTTEIKKVDESTSVALVNFRQDSAGAWTGLDQLLRGEVSRLDSTVAAI